MSDDWEAFQDEIRNMPVVEIASVTMAARRLGWSREKVQTRAVEDGVIFDARPLKLGNTKWAVPAAWVEKQAAGQAVTA